MKGLATLARTCGVQMTFRDNAGRTMRATDEAIQAVLAGMGIDASTPAAVVRAIAERRASMERPGVEPVVIVPAGRSAQATVRVRMRTEAAECALVEESGETHEWLARLEPAGSATGSNSCSALAALDLPALPPGYHRLHLEMDGERHEATVIATPGRAAPLPHVQWGLFAPLYALRSGRGAAAGDIAALEALGQTVGALGASIVGTLPLLAAFLDQPIDPSPYMPVSRSAWNEFYATVEDVPGYHQSTADRAGRYVDYERVAAMKRDAMSRAAEEAFATGRWDEVERYATTRPHIERYARFRAALKSQGRTWHGWPESMRSGALPDGAYDPAEYRYHLYAQWLTWHQLRATGERLGAAGVSLYLDFPVGVHPDGFDAWQHQSLFAGNCNTGAPPDSFFAGGQDWGFRPMAPEALRRAAYAPLREAWSHHMAVAGMLRIDHVMGFHRLYWVPHGMGATEGVYVRYPSHELYAVLCVESQRHSVPVVGEDLGTVPAAVRREITRHGLGRMYVVQTELRPGEPVPPPPPANSVASLNTHDMPTFAAFWNGEHEGASADAAFSRRRQQALRTVAGSKDTGADSVELAAALHGWLASTKASIVLINPDDLVGELEPHNVPGTSHERPNWRRRAAWTIEDLASAPAFSSLRRLARRRKGARP